MSADPKRYLIYLFKGQYYAAAGQHEAAVIALMQANSLGKTVAAFSLLVDTHLSLGNLREANYCAREAVVSYGRVALPHVLLGKVLMRAPSNENSRGGTTKHADALRCFENALRCDPREPQAALCRAEIQLENGLLKEAIAGLKQAIGCRSIGRAAGGGFKSTATASPSPSASAPAPASAAAVRAMLGRLLGVAGQFSEALQVLHLAVSLDPLGKTGATAVSFHH